jgi:predicted GIY-YIG superfamily endonuclease
MTVYLIHMDKPLHHAQHYLGYTCLLPTERLATHQAGQGSAMLRAVNGENISYKIVRIWEGATRTDERQLKKQKNSARFCPICNQKSWKKRGILS